MTEPLICEHGLVYDDGRAWTPTTGDPPPDGCLNCHTQLVIQPMLARGFRPPPVVRAAAKATAAAPPPPARCANLGVEPVRVAGSTRRFLPCLAGFGTPLPDARKGLVCTTCTAPGVWRTGRECGPKCPGYAAGRGLD